METFVNIFFSTYSLVVYAIIFMLFYGVWSMQSVSKMSSNIQVRSIAGLFLWCAFMFIGIAAYAYNHIESQIKASDLVFILPITALLSYWGIRRAKKSMKLEEDLKFGIESMEYKNSTVGFIPKVRLVVFWILLVTSVVGTCIAAFCYF